MRVGVNATAIRVGISGGLEGYSLNLCAALALRREIALTVFGSPVFCERLRELVDNDSVDIAEVASAGAGRLQRVIWEQGRLAHEARLRSLDVLHSLTYVSTLRSSEISSVVTIPDLLVYRLPDCVPTLKRIYWRMTIPRSVKTADALISISDFTRREICRVFPRAADKVVVTPLGLDHRLVDRGLDYDARESSSADSRFLLCVGGLGLHKNTETVLRGLALHRDQWGPDGTPSLVIVGRDYGAGRALRTLTMELGLDKRVEFAGRVSYQDLCRLYRTAMGLLAISRYEGFGLPVLEAMSYGLPVVVGTGGAPAEVAGEAGWIIDESSPQAVARAVDVICRDGAAVAARVDAGLARARSFTWDRTAVATITAYRAALGENFGDVTA